MDELREALTHAQKALALSPTYESLQIRMAETKQEFLFWSKVAVIFMHQRLKEDKLLEGDANTKLFHGSLKRNHYSIHICSVTEESGVHITYYSLVRTHFSDYYINLLRRKTYIENEIDPMVIREGPVLSVDQQLSLLSEVDADRPMLG